MGNTHDSDEGHANAVAKAAAALNEVIAQASQDGLRVDVHVETLNRVGLAPRQIISTETSRLYTPRPEPRMSRDDIARALMKDSNQHG